MRTSADRIATEYHPKCPSCNQDMQAGVLSGGSDMTGHTDEYFCDFDMCKIYKIRVTVSIRDPTRAKI